MYLCFEHVYFGCSTANVLVILVDRSRMRFPWAGTPRKPLTGLIGQGTTVTLVVIRESSDGKTVQCLVRGCTDVACIVCVGPLCDAHSGGANMTEEVLHTVPSVLAP